MHKLLGEPVLRSRMPGGKSLKSASSAQVVRSTTRKRRKADELLIDHVKEVLAIRKRHPDDLPRKVMNLPASSGSVSTTWWALQFRRRIRAKERRVARTFPNTAAPLLVSSGRAQGPVRSAFRDRSAGSGRRAGENTDAFRKAMAAPRGRRSSKTASPTRTHEYWPDEIDAVQAKVNVIKSEFATKQRRSRNSRKWWRMEE